MSEYEYEARLILRENTWADPGVGRGGRSIPELPSPEEPRFVGAGISGQMCVCVCLCVCLCVCVCVCLCVCV